jgi:hypothetical protein
VDLEIDVVGRVAADGRQYRELIDCVEFVYPAAGAVPRRRTTVDAGWTVCAAEV